MKFSITKAKVLQTLFVKGQMTSSDTALSSALNQLDMDSKESTPERDSQTPIDSISEETVSILKDATRKHKRPKKSVSKRALDTSPSTSEKDPKRARVAKDESSATREQYSPSAKPVYLKAKQLYIKKLHLATNVQFIKDQLDEGLFPIQVNFKCPAPQKDSTEFALQWTKTVSEFKKTLTQLWIDELSRKYVVCKSDIRKALENLKSILNKEQFQEVKKSLDDRYKEAASKKMGKKLQQQKKPAPQPPKKGAKGQNRRPMNQNQQFNKLLNGLSKLIKNQKN